MRTAVLATVFYMALQMFSLQQMLDLIALPFLFIAAIDLLSGVRHEQQN